MKWNLNCPSFQQKKFSHANPRIYEIFKFKIWLTWRFLLFFPYKSRKFHCFYLILPNFFLSEFHWNFWCGVFLNHKKHISDRKSRKITKKYFWPPFCMKSAHCELIHLRQKFHPNNSILSKVMIKIQFPLSFLNFGGPSQNPP